jgi:hypothetical protein
MERMAGIDCHKGNYLVNQLGRPERVLSKKEQKQVFVSSLKKKQFLFYSHSLV